MEIVNKQIPLKDGSICVVRTALPEEAAEVLRCFAQTHRETDYLTTYPEENDMTPESEKAYLAGFSEGRGMELCAWIGGRLAGTAGFAPVRERIKTAHRAEFGISVEKDRWGLGIGRALTEECIEQAKKQGFLQLELEVVAENERALSLYRSAGFREYGRNPRGFRTKDGRWQELVLMRLDLEDDTAFKCREAECRG